MLGQDSSNLGPVEHRMNQESGGNPRAINLWDINAQRGDPSRGLMQVIGSTFAAYRSFALSSNIYDPMANVFAGLNYATNSPAYRGRSLSSGMMQPGGDRAGARRLSPLRFHVPKFLDRPVGVGLAAALPYPLAFYVRTHVG